MRLQRVWFKVLMLPEARLYVAHPSVHRVQLDRPEIIGALWAEEHVSHRGSLRGSLKGCPGRVIWLA